MPLPLVNFALAALLAAPAGLQNRPPPAGSTEVRPRVESYLDSIDTPVRPEDWRALGPGAAKVLEEIAQDPRRLPTRRARALAALAVIGSPRASKLVVAVAQREGEKPVVRMSALRAAGQLLPAAELVPVVQPVLEGARDLHVRATAAAVLARGAPKQGCPAVRAQSGREKLETRGALDPAIAICDRAAAAR